MFEHLWGHRGGAILLEGSSVVRSTLQIVSSDFRRNRANMGGGLSVEGNVEVRVEKTRLTDNKAIRYKFLSSNITSSS
jgi:hypothetical protein